MKTLRIIASCKDRVGIVSKIASYLLQHEASIFQANQHVDDSSGRIFMRYVIKLSEERSKPFIDGFCSVADALEMEWRIVDADRPQRTVFLVSKFDHCLAYLLHRWKVNDMPCDIPCVISNHETLKDLVEWHGIPFHHVPVPKDENEKLKAFQAIADLIDQNCPDTIVLARYMQIFPEWLCERYKNKVINIHHSFLPSFAGANPYRQAQTRGVKLIGATCHYVTAELDAGPIIEQDVVRIRHSDTLKDLLRYGKDVENTVLARGLRYHLEDRVLVHGNKTIVFES